MKYFWLCVICNSYMHRHLNWLNLSPDHSGHLLFINTISLPFLYVVISSIFIFVTWPGHGSKVFLVSFPWSPSSGFPNKAFYFKSSANGSSFCKEMVIRLIWITCIKQSIAYTKNWSKGLAAQRPIQVRKVK